METVCIAFGSNLGRRQENIRKALALLAARLRITAISPVIESAPAEGATGRPFLNGVCLCATKMPPEELLLFLRHIERRMGRPFPRRKNQPRVIDLDIILYGARVMRNARLTIPHPRFARRRFVLQPLAAVAPHMKDPRTGRTIAELCGACAQ